MSACISAVQQLRRLRGGSQSHLLAASDGASYVTKFRNNPQHVRVLANEMLATRLGLALGLPMPHVEAIEVSDWLIQHCVTLSTSTWPEGTSLAKAEGNWASFYADQKNLGLTHDYLPTHFLETIANVQDFARVAVLDKWTCNCDGRQAVFSRKTSRSRRYVATFIDQGYCFNAGEWSFPDCPLRGVFANNCVYKDVRGWDAFEPALSRAEQMDANEIWGLAADIPEEWYEWDKDGLNRLLETLHRRRSLIRKLISEFRKCSRDPFPNWRESPVFVAGPAEGRDEGAEIH